MGSAEVQNRRTISSPTQIFFSRKTENDNFILNIFFPFFRTLMKQLSPIETYAFKHVEHTQKIWKECQIVAIDAEIEAQKKEFDEKKLEEMAEAIGAGASATPTEDGSTASETEVDEGDDDSDDEVDDGDSDDESSDEDEDRVRTIVGFLPSVKC